jgi:hypothetical protein
MTQAGQEVKAPNILIQTYMLNDTGLMGPNTEQTIDYERNEFGFVISRIRGFGTIDKLDVIKYMQAMARLDHNNWKEVVHNEYKHMELNNVFEVNLLQKEPCMQKL